MKKPIHLHLSRRESQIMDIVFRLGEATAEEVRRNMLGRRRVREALPSLLKSLTASEPSVRAQAAHSLGSG